MDFNQAQGTESSAAVVLQRQYFATGQTLNLDFRLRQLALLKQTLKDFEQPILAALKQDLGKSACEGYATEIGVVQAEISLLQKMTPYWSKPQQVSTPMEHQPAKSVIYQEPLGIVLIIAPWNYPINLALAPLAAALAAGNCCIIKPSEYAPATAGVLAQLVAKTFDPKYVQVIQGGVETSQALLAEEFDHIFFTGSTQVGKVVMRAAAEHLTTVTLELGGKSPCLIAPSANLDVSAKRIIWGKLINAGQTCVAPDYLLAPRDAKETLLADIEKWIGGFYGSDPLGNGDYPKIINQNHYQRLKDYLTESQASLALGGNFDDEQQKIAPTVLWEPNLGNRVMNDEIFGPILPIIPYDDLGWAVDFIKARPKPLAFYLFSKDKDQAEDLFAGLSFGGGCLNDTIIHLANPNLPFGGVGASGMGAYHGQKGFETFSHYKSILSRSSGFELPVRYPPYSDSKLSLIKKVLK